MAKKITEMDLFSDYSFGQLIGKSIHRHVELPPLPDEKYHYLANTYQIFGLHFITPTNDFFGSQNKNPDGSEQPPRMFFKWATGTGKTSLAIRIMSMYLRFPGIKTFILGFENTKEAFQNDAFKFPELGYVSQAEHTRLEHLRKNYYRSGMPLARQELQSFQLRLKARFNARTNDGGVFQYGYQEFANRVGFSDTGDVDINESFVQSLAGSLFILDEVHNAYNSIGFNSRGFALKHVFDRLSNKVHVIALSATPMNNNPAESIELASLLNTGRLDRTTYFRDGNMIDEGAFAKLFHGKVSVVNVNDTSLYPIKRFAPGSVELPGCGPDFMFLTCAMSKYHQDAWVKCQEIVSDEETIELGEDLVRGNTNSTYFMRDFALPKSDKSPCLTVFDLNSNYPSGNVPLNMLVESELDIWSAKYARMIRDVKKMRGKTLIFHPRIAWGIKLIERIMRAAHYVQGDEAPEKETPCAICGETVDKHVKGSEHAYTAARFLTIHASIDTTQRTRSRSIWNAVSNTNGNEYQFLIGSQIITVGFDFNSVQNLVVCGLPDTYHALLQLFGRAIRQKSHMNLPQTKRVVTIHDYVNTFSFTSPNQPFTPERYIIKYPVYREIEKVLTLLEQIGVDKTVYDPATEEPRDDLERTVYYSRELFEDELANVYRIIKRLFLIRSMWKIEDLMSAIRNPPIKVTINISKVTDDTIIFVLRRIIYQGRDRSYLSTVGVFKQANDMTSCLFNFNAEAKFVIKGDEVYVIMWVAPFLMLRPVSVMRKSLMDEITPRERHIRFRINLVSDEISRLLKVDKPTHAIFKQFSSAIHESTIRALLDPSSKDKNPHLVRFYESIGVIRGDEYVTAKNGFRLVGTNWFPTPTHRPPLVKILGFYQDCQFKLINTITLAENREDARTSTRGTACMNKSQAELVAISEELKLGNIKQRDHLCEKIETHLNTMQLKDGSRNTYVLYWGPPE